MSITFCDLCDESIPQADLEHGAAVWRGSRAICARCERAMADGERDQRTAGERAPEVASALAANAARRVERSDPLALHGSHFDQRPAPGAGPALLLGVLALCFALAASLYLLWRIDRGRRDLASAQAGWQAELTRVGSGLGERLDAHAAEVAERARAAQGEAQVLALRLEDGLAAQDQELARVRSELAALATRTERVEAAPGSAGAGEVSGESFARLERELAEARTELGRLAELFASGAAGGAREAGAAAPEQQGPAWNALLPGLQSRNASERWSAVQALGQTGDGAVVPHVLPMLKDPDIFVRMAACRVLADLRAVRAIPALIDALEDAEPSVREGAVGALRAISGQDLRFDPNASAGERAKRVEAWRGWWTQARDGLLGGG